MAQQIDQLRENLRLKLTDIDDSLSGLKARIEGKTQHTEQDAQSHLEKVQKRIEQNRAKVSAAQAEVKGWMEGRKTATADKVAEWKAKHETSKLQHRADQAERYAAAAMDVALADLDEAEEAALEAWIARQDAHSAQAKKA